MSPVPRSEPNQRGGDPAAGAIDDELKQLATLLHDCVTELRRAVSLSPARLLNVARRLLIEGADRPAADFALPGLAESLATLFPAPRFACEAEVYAGGIQGAQLIGALAPRIGLPQERLEWLALAALLRDAGLITPGAQRRLAPRKLANMSPQLFRAHPEWSAALVAGLDDCPVDVPRWIAQHHERLDGTGFPSQPEASQIAASARWLAVVSRFVEALHADEFSANASRSDAPPWWSAACTLHSEARRGELDSECVHGLLRVLDEQLPGAIAAGPIAQPAEAHISGRTWRFDNPHPHLRGPAGGAQRATNPVSQARSAGDLRRPGDDARER